MSRKKFDPSYYLNDIERMAKNLKSQYPGMLERGEFDKSFDDYFETSTHPKLKQFKGALKAKLEADGALKPKDGKKEPSKEKQATYETPVMVGGVTGFGRAFTYTRKSSRGKEYQVTQYRDTRGRFARKL